MIHKHRLIDHFTRLLALGVMGCGATICYSGLSFLSQSTQPFQENLRALSGTIQELERTVVDLRKQSGSLDAYFETLERSLAKTKADLQLIDSAAIEFLKLAGNSSAKLMNETAEAATNASKLMHDTANEAGAIPFDPLAEKRKLLYSMAGNFTSIATDLKVTATGISDQTLQFQKLASSSLATSRQVIGSTEEQVAILREGPVERMPIVLEALSKQLSAHVKLIDASYGLLNQVSQPIIAVGVGFILLGLRGLLMRQAVPSTSIPLN
jgi:hypothetical protein